MLSTSLSLRESLLALQGVDISVGASYFPLFISLLLSFFTASASFIVLDIIRHKRHATTFSDNTLAFSREIFWKLVATLLLRWLYIFLYSLIWMIGLSLIILGVFLYYGNASDTSSLFLIVSGGLIYLLGLFLVAVKQYSYSMAEYILYDQISADNYQGPRAVLTYSKSLTKGYKWKLFLLDLSFIGWYLLTACTLGILYIYVLPYTTTARVIFYDKLLTLKED